MKRFVSVATLSLAALCAPSAGATATQDDDYKARTVEFCSTRPGPAAAARTNPRPGPKQGTSAAASRNQGRRNGGASAADSATTRKPADAASDVRLGLGFTVYKRSGSGAPVRVDPRQPFADGDKIRVVLESNVDGYLYIFNTDSDGGAATMIYPQVRLDAGENRIEAHRPTEVPSRFEENPGNQWLVLSGGPLVDRLTFVVSAEPLPGVPTGAALARWCGENRDCYWQPQADAWKRVPSAGDSSAPVAASRSYGEEMSKAENLALDGRAVRLGPEAPAPAAVAMSESARARFVVAAVDLSHRPRR